MVKEVGNMRKIVEITKCAHSANNELRLFIKDITLFLQKPSNYNAGKIEPMFQRAYKLYSKYDVENTP